MDFGNLPQLSLNNEGIQKTFNVPKKLNEYFCENSEIFRSLREVRKKGWDNEDGDVHFQRQKKTADQSTDNKKNQKYFFGLMRRIGAELQKSNQALSIKCHDPCIMDLCMAPGGYTASAIEVNPSATVFGVTLPVAAGGHPLLLKRSPNIHVRFTDITMEAAEIGITDIPYEHPDRRKFKTVPLLAAKRKFDLVFCDGQVLRNHAVHRHPDRERYEATRLTITQMIIAIRHVKQGGTMIVLLHKVEAWQTVKMLRAFDKFSDIQLFKPTVGHVSRSSFYMVAQNIRPDHDNALTAKNDWLQMWKDATFHQKSIAIPDKQEFLEILEGFGKKLIGLAEPIWMTQKNGIENSRWYQTSQKREEAVLKGVNEKREQGKNNSTEGYDKEQEDECDVRMYEVGRESLIEEAMLDGIRQIHGRFGGPIKSKEA